MDIIGVDYVYLGVFDMEASKQCLRDFGLHEVDHGEMGADFLAEDGTGLMVRHWEDPSLPAAVCTGPNFRDTVWGVRDAATLDQIAAELRKDREAVFGEGGRLRSHDDDGYPITFHVSQRKPIHVEAPAVNVPSLPPMRKANVIADYQSRVRPLTLGHHVWYTLDMPKSEKFYVERLGFRVTDRFTKTGSFMRSQGCIEHHNMYLIERPGTPLGLNHIAFHVRDQLEMMRGGKQFAALGHKTAWGPGRHIFGSNNFWYFKSPFGGNLEYDADIDVVDDTWQPRETPISLQAGAYWLVESFGV
jgi:catechol 2,3-dioxygenase-like lactoylglutathione lyase family enzyme